MAKHDLSQHPLTDGPELSYISEAKQKNARYDEDYLINKEYIGGGRRDLIMTKAKKDKNETLGKTEIKNKFIELKAKGWSYRRIADELSLSKSTLANWGHELEMEIASAKAMELEALQEEYYCVKEARIQFLGQTLKKLKKEVEKRDLKKLPTDKLFNMTLKYQAALTTEFDGIGPLSEDQIANLKGKSEMKLDAEQIAVELDRVLQRFRLGKIDDDGVMAELAVCKALLRAHDQFVLQRKFEEIQSVLGKGA